MCPPSRVHLPASIIPPMLLHRPILSTSVAVLDFETTGLYPGADRVVEVSVVRIDPGQAPRLVFDTLIHPQRDVAATFVHGITDAMVADAPTFEEVAPALLHHLSDAVLATYNVSFDYPFLDYELTRAGYRHALPRLCLMYMRPLLGLGPRCRLEAACACHGIRLTNAHQTATDTLAAAKLWPLCQQAAAAQNLTTFEDLKALKRRPYKFCDSWRLPPLPTPPPTLFPTPKLKSRAHNLLEQTLSHTPTREGHQTPAPAQLTI